MEFVEVYLSDFGSPLEVVQFGFGVWVFDPSALQQCIPQILIVPTNNEDLAVGSRFFPPLGGVLLPGLLPAVLAGLRLMTFFPLFAIFPLGRPVAYGPKQDILIGEESLLVDVPASELGIPHQPLVVFVIASFGVAGGDDF